VPTSSARGLQEQSGIYSFCDFCSTGQYMQAKQKQIYARLLSLFSCMGSLQTGYSVVLASGSHSRRHWSTTFNLVVTRKVEGLKENTCVKLGRSREGGLIDCTHSSCSDQLFSRIAQYLRKHDAYDKKAFWKLSSTDSAANNMKNHPWWTIWIAQPTFLIG